jgi:hypothetical protein
MVLFGSTQIASPRSLPTLLTSMSNAAEIDVHQAGDELVQRRVAVVLHALDQR